MRNAILRRLAGPGLIFTGAAIGTSHLVQSTRAGAMFGVALSGQETIARAQARPIAINRRIEEEFGADALLQFTQKLNRLIDLCDEEQMAEVEE